MMKVLAFLALVATAAARDVFHDGMTPPFESQDGISHPPVRHADTSNARSTNRQQVHLNFAKLEPLKVSKTSLWTPSSSSNRVTLTKMKYVIVPIWFNDEPKTAFDTATTEKNMKLIAESYAQMSWNKFSLSWSILDPVQLAGISRQNPGRPEILNAVQTHLAALGLVNPRDFDAIITMYYKPQSGSLANGGGWGMINGNFIWVTTPGSAFILRHEIGHNLGHPHHKSNGNALRSGGGGPDGFDFMSGSDRDYNISDLAAASKWHYNWIPDEAVVLMQPEGSTTECPTCRSSVTKLVLQAFDNSLVSPSSTNQMGVHIPISGTESTGLASYWLSYRGLSNAGKASGGLSIHTTSFYWFGGPFGASYDSLSFDAFGDTTQNTDSFVVPNTCYLLTPPITLLKVDPVVAPTLQPVVCVDSVAVGSNITISVSFLNPAAPPPAKINVASQRELACAVDSSNKVDMTGNTVHMLSYKQLELGKTLAATFCRESASSDLAVTAYFYDAYPHAYLTYGGPPSYGAFRSLNVTATCTSQSKLDYLTYGQAHILLVGSSPSAAATSTSTVQWTLQCAETKCLANQYRDDPAKGGGFCINCPDGSWSSEGSTSASACLVGAAPPPSNAVPSSPIAVPNVPSSPSAGSPSVPSVGSPTVSTPSGGDNCAKCRSLLGLSSGRTVHRTFLGLCIEKCTILSGLKRRFLGWKCGPCP